MSHGQQITFRDYFNSMYSMEPFPWQERLAERAQAGHWPPIIALPTAAGKTSILDIALLALANQSSLDSSQRTSPRRIFFVVDRRVIVDEAYKRAQRIAEALAHASKGVLFEVAQRLRKISGGETPLECFQLRGGVYREDNWARTPLQATIIASTVDQVGSRLLFRGYGLRTGSLWPVHAGLVANDSLIILDEAHCAEPFRQTLEAISRYRTWTREGPFGPFHVSIMSATPRQSPQIEIFGPEQADLKHRVLGKRINASKPCSLVEVPITDQKEEDDKVLAMVRHLTREAQVLANVESPQAVAVLVNRIATAKMVFTALQADDSIDVVLLIGRMRPLDRDRVVGKWLERLKSDLSGKRTLERPVIVVATQCLEVGADLDFDAMVTECAPLDALRQRFGRLNRMGRKIMAQGAIVIRKDHAGKYDDILYGQALSSTWRWLKKKAHKEKIDMGAASLDSLLAEEADETLGQLFSPRTDAPVMLPAYLDCWVQTSPCPMPDPDPAIFLHGPERGVPEVQVLWRNDLDPEADPDTWIQTVSLFPPNSGECMPVMLHTLRNWMTSIEGANQDNSDVIGGMKLADAPGQPKKGSSSPHVLRWLGPEDSEVITDPRRIKPGDTLVLSEADGGGDVLGHIPHDLSKPGLSIDLAEEARMVGGRRIALRLTPAFLKQLPECDAKSVAGELCMLEDAPEDVDSVRTTLELLALQDDVSPWISEISTLLASDPKLKVSPHPLRGLVLQGRRRITSFTDEDSTSSSTRMVDLKGHCERVRERCGAYAEACGLPAERVADLALAAELHDLGKLDPRFQIWLNGGRRPVPDTPLAKSIRLPQSLVELRQTRERSGYPQGARHELLSVRLAESSSDLLSQAKDLELVLHLVAAHHGRCRPFAPVVQDDAPVDVDGTMNGQTLRASSATGLERLDSGVSERFWSCVRRYGWWGLAWMESLCRLADHRISEEEDRNVQDTF